METLQFKTNINCGGCVAKVTPFLNQLEEVESWKVDTNNPDKILTVSGEEVSCELIQRTVEQAGFKIEQI
ncbi:heavy-metal-associated domain-containing protein [Runella sp. MFBS21]|uniref:heavy-metal-associated domain-containing protein n=1 Tax=Runella sp. MFBS21 TaxID=3034018 RepID=UPI0023F8F673|nr:heavy-metal-associated domain-containing protein [Runella sp. MFBS21]MCA0233145.1 heavy-metal-associated domain-containing protein [Bacteroidota bacterium]MDF7821268.1 heavy-metal-associated domain-containing protein [Runella sp. MFBS21]